MHTSQTPPSKSPTPVPRVGLLTPSAVSRSAANTNIRETFARARATWAAK